MRLRRAIIITFATLGLAAGSAAAMAAATAPAVASAPAGQTANPNMFFHD